MLYLCYGKLYLFSSRVFIQRGRLNETVNRVVESTTEYIETMPKTMRKKYGQFFTSKETAVFMASLFDITEENRTISILDPGAGSGILSIAFLE